MNILLTGGTGFIGKQLLQKLEKTAHSIAAISRNQMPTGNNIKIIAGNINSNEKCQSEITQFDPDAVIHLAWEMIPDFSFEMCQYNLFNSIKFFDLVFENTNFTKIIVSGSCFEYGKKQGACKESDPAQIDSYFTWAKHSLNQYLSIKCAEHNVVLNWFRLFYVYGPGQRGRSLIPTLISAIGAKQTPKITTPFNKNDLVYVGDVATAVAKAVDADLPSGVYNLGSGYTTSVYDICRIVEQQLLGNETISKQVLDYGQKDETVNFWADMKKTEHALNMSCNTSLKEGIKQHIQSMKSNIRLSGRC